MQIHTLLKNGVRTFREDRRGISLLLITGGSFLLIGVQMIYPVLLPNLRATYGFNLTTSGLLLSLLWVANAGGQIPGGLLADRIGEKATLVASLVLSAGTLALIISVNSVIALFAATLLLGAGLALYGVARYTAMYDMYPEQAGTTIGIVQAGADAGQALLPPIASALAATFVWQMGFGFTLPLFVPLAVGLWIYLPARTTTASSHSMSLTEVVGVVAEMRTRAIMTVTAILFVYAVIWVSFTSFYPTYLIEIKGLSTLLSSVFFGLFFAAGVVVKPLSGVVYDRRGLRTTLFAISVVSGIALVALPITEGPAALAVVTVAVAPILGTGTVAQSHLLEHLSESIRGTGLGIARTITLTAAAITPVIFGAAADRGYFDEAFLALAALAGVLLLLTSRIPTD